MEDKAPGCPRCSGEMETGFLLDRNYTKQLPALWIEGVPELSGVWGSGAKITGRRSYWVTTWRCKNCGYLESYGKNSAG